MARVPRKVWIPACCLAAPLLFMAAFPGLSTVLLILGMAEFAASTPPFIHEPLSGAAVAAFAHVMAGISALASCLPIPPAA